MKKLLLLISIIFIAGASVEDARKANEAYRNGNYAEAIELYKKAIDTNPENAKLYYNLGNALAKEGNTEEAIRYFEQFKTMTNDPEQRAMADYNIGNIHSETKKWDQAVNAYKKSLRYQSADIDAKHNYELALKKNQEQQNQQQQNQQQQNQQNQQQDQQQNQQQQNQQQEQQQDQQQQDQQQQEQQQQNQQNQNQQQQPKPNQISKAEAEKILKALEQKEKELLKEFKKQKTKSSNNENEKDW